MAKRQRQTHITHLNIDTFCFAKGLNRESLFIADDYRDLLTTQAYTPQQVTDSF